MISKVISGIIYFIIINICLFGIFNVDIPQYIYILNYIIIIIAAFFYAYKGHKILKKVEENETLMEKVYYKEKQIALKESKFKKQIDDLNDEIKDITMQFSSLMIKIRDLLTEKNSISICEIFMEILEKTAGVSHAQILFKDKNELFIKYAIGMSSSKYSQIKIILDDTTLIGMAAVYGQIMTTENLKPGQEFKGKQSDKSPLTTIIAMPIISKNNVIGVINIEKLNERKYNKVDRLTFTTLAHLAGISFADSDV